MDPVISVPHTGTRTLVRHLGATQFYHFGQNEADFVDKVEHFHFPVRDPLDTSLSWRSYQPDRTDMGEFRRWDSAIDYLADHKHTVHVMENYPVLEGQSGKFWWKRAARRWQLDELLALPEVEYLLDWITIPTVQSFFLQYYPEGFWWQEMAKQPSLRHSEPKAISAAGSPPTYRDGRLIV